MGGNGAGGMSAPSARGLFRATGKASRPVVVRSLGDMPAAYEKVEHLEREADDFYPTPPEPTRALLAYEREHLTRFSTIWEPSCGDGAMGRVIEDAGFSVEYSDLIDRGCGAQIADFFAFSQAPCPAIITNPPYNRVNAAQGKGAWVSHAMGTLGVEYMALLLNWSWPGAAGLSGIWNDFPPARVYLMRWKIDFTGQGAPPMLNGWFVWDRRHVGEPVLRMMDRIDSRQGELL
jgi:hypothetical protein